MSSKLSTTLLSLPAAALTGSETLAAVQGGGLVGVPASQLSALAARNNAPRIRICAQEGGWRGISSGVNQSNGTTQTSSTDRLKFTLNTDVSAMRFVFINGFVTSSAINQLNGNALNFYAALEQGANLVTIPFPGNNGAAISSGGRAGNWIGDGALLESGWINGYSPAAATRYYRIYKAVASGQKWPHTVASTDKGWPGANTTDQVYANPAGNGSDQTASYGAQSWGPFASTAYAWAAVAVIGRQVTPVPVVMHTGDSISAGYGSTIGQGYLGLACSNAGVAYHNDGISGSTLANLLTYNQGAQYLADYVDHIVIHALTNDLFSSGATVTTLAQAQTIALNALKAFGRPNSKAWLCPVLPRPSSTTDGWASYGGQTLNASAELVRVQYNNWLRDATSTGAAAYFAANLPASLRYGGTIDATPAVERTSTGAAVVLDANGQQSTAAGSGGYYLTNGTAGYATTDGTHPTNNAVALMAPLVNAGQRFVLF